MIEEHIIVVDDEESICTSVAQKIDNKYGNNYLVSKFLSAEDALDFMDKDIDRYGDNLALIVSDERLNTMQGHTFLKKAISTHPRSKKIANTAYSDPIALEEIAKLNISGFARKDSIEKVGDELFNKIDEQLKLYEKERPLAFQKKNVVFSEVDTLAKKIAFSKLRYKVYLEEGHKTLDLFRQEEIDSHMEWDSYDVGGIDSMIIGPDIRYVVAMLEDSLICAGGLRIIDRDLPMETGLCVKDGFGFKKGDNLDLDRLESKYRSEGLFRREISRLIVDEKYREGGRVLFGLFRMTEQLTKSEPTMMCTARPNTIGLYQTIGFEICAPNILYSLANEWTPLIRRWWTAHNNPESIGMNLREISLHKMLAKPIVKDEEWSERAKTLHQAAIEKGFYNTSD